MAVVIQRTLAYPPVVTETYPLPGRTDARLNELLPVRMTRRSPPRTDFFYFGRNQIRRPVEPS